jgi:hypothetical protein
MDAPVITSASAASASSSAEKGGKTWNGDGMTQDDFMKKDECILCNELDEVIGSASKYDAHIFSPETVGLNSTFFSL